MNSFLSKILVYLLNTHFILKGPKPEIFGSRVFAQIRPVWVGDLGTRPKNPRLGWFRHENRHFILLSAVGDNAKDFFTLSPTSLQILNAVADNA
jgi:hypothetical protein